MKNRPWWIYSSAIILTLLAQSCDPVPRRQLTAAEKEADLMWVYSQFGENYAPLDYKQKIHNFNYEKLKVETIEVAKKTKDNQEFYEVLLGFISKFKDAHTSGSLTASSLPDRAQVAYLGFGGKRKGDVLVVQRLLPTIDKNSVYPIKVGDRIVQVNGKTLPEIVRTELVQYRDVGTDEGNLTYHMNKIFQRVSIVNGLPAGDTATLMVERGSESEPEKKTISLPWVLKDLHSFKQEQAKATDKKATAEEEAKALKAAENYLMIDNGLLNPMMKFNFIGFDGRALSPAKWITQVTRGLRKSVKDSFKFIDGIAGWAIIADNEEEKTPEKLMREERDVPKAAFFVAAAKTFPAYVSSEKTLDKDGKATGEEKLVGTIYVDTFSPENDEETVLKEFKETVNYMRVMGVKHLIIDTINNGGGSLILGMHMIQALTPTKATLPMIQLRLSDSWMDEFESSSLRADNDASAELARRTLVQLENEKESGLRLSSPMSVEALAPYEIADGNSELKEPFKIAVMVNEMCASMCDIFAAAMQDNQLATIVGAKTMGAGGNVVNYQQAPNSHIDVRQTESLLLRKDGSYLENNGVDPDVVVKVNESSTDGYDKVRDAALKALLTQQ